jgi:geranylgeranyl reductase family protein
MTPLWDAVIVGAGPAGASAAHFLGEMGLRVLVLERESLPRDKPCGGAVPRSALARFPFDFGPVIEDAVTLVRYAWLGEEVAVLLPDAPVLMVRRREFDMHILAHARAEVRDRTAVSEVRAEDDVVSVRTADGATHAGRYLLVCEGSTGALAAGLGLGSRRAATPTLQAEVPMSQAGSHWRGTALFQFGALPGGYIWVFPRRESLSVGIVDFRRGRRPLRRVLEAELARLGIGADGVRWRGHPLPVFAGRGPLGRGRVLLLGDAAGLVDPLLGEGIRYAIRSGQLAADAVGHNLSAAEYTRRVMGDMGRSLQRAREIAGLFYRVPRLAYSIATQDERGTRWMTDVLAERSDYCDMSHRLPRLVADYFRRRIGGKG